ncbi:hypothetical protein [Escherichia coli]
MFSARKWASVFLKQWGKQKRQKAL